MSNNDLKLIKEKILTDEKVGELLELMDCEHVEKKNNRYEAQLPNKFESPNKRSVQVYLNESMSSRIRTLGESDIDIYGLVSYIVFDKFLEEERRSNLPKSKRWICEKLGYTEFLNESYTPLPTSDHLKWLREVKKQRKKKRNLDHIENQIYGDDILSQFIMVPHLLYINEGINYLTQIEFQVGYDIKSQRIIYPIHNSYGDIVSIKGRTIFDDYEERDIYKFLYLINFNKMVELYNWHRALFYIIENKEVLIYEGEKSTWLSSQYGFRNCVAISGDDLSDWQVSMIKGLGIEIDIIIALDKDKSIEAVKKQGAKFGKTRNVYALWDRDGMFSNKDSPTDLGEVVFKRLYSEYKFKIHN
ncbi:DNA primase [Paenibacillus donghaensis]|uniref:DNA primase n=1 Tax=Paenibacillus donghaensis TaxID=414771 RepID=A0A2Z2KQK0_9BACL|nr:DNA primase [Paenibacillus donghaensis]ASA22611.1 DNA primase [Paenibacillus donghaensis]